MSGLKLQVGKFYRDRAGNKVGPIEAKNHASEWPFGEADGPKTFRPDGSWLCEEGRVSERDLIAEWPNAPTGPVRTVTRKEIVPGSYGGVEVTHVDYATEDHGANVCIRIDNGFGPDSLRAAIATLTEIADALEAPAQ